MVPFLQQMLLWSPIFSVAISEMEFIKGLQNKESFYYVKTLDLWLFLKMDIVHDQMVKLKTDLSQLKYSFQGFLNKE